MASKMHGGGLRGRVTQESAEDAARRQRGVEKTEIAEMAIEEYNLSFVVGKFSGHDRWAVKDYEVTVADNGTLAVTDRDSEMLVYAYAAPGIDWHKLWLEYQPDIKQGQVSWYTFDLQSAHKEFLNRKGDA